MTRRALLATLAFAGCGRRLARRVYAMLFVASAGEKGLAVADLSDFRRAGFVSLGETPRDVFRAGTKLFATCPDARTLFEIDARNFRVAGKTLFPGRIAGAAVPPDASRIAVAVEQPPALHLVDPATRKIVKRIPLPGVPTGIDAANDLAVLSTASGLIRVALPSGAVAGVTDLGLRPGVFRLHSDAKLILVGAADGPEIVTVSCVSGALMARLPLAFTPARFCFNADRGQMFVTGNSGDQIVIVSPYQCEVDQTIVGGRTPCGMAVGAVDGRNLLFVTNPGSGDVTLFDIDTRQHAASVHVGGRPGEVLLTPGGEYALVVDQDNGDVAVIRIRTVLNREATRAAPVAKPIFTIFHTGPAPQSAAIV
jgi:YVTN family beta-propeller protein